MSDLTKIKDEMTDHFAEDTRQFDALHEKLNIIISTHETDHIKLQEMLKPILELYIGSRFTFNTITGTFKLLVLIGAVVGAIISLMKLK